MYCRERDTKASGYKFSAEHPRVAVVRKGVKNTGHGDSEATKHNLHEPRGEFNASTWTLTKKGGIMDGNPEVLASTAEKNWPQQVVRSSPL